MSSEGLHVLASYDIHDPKRLSRVAKIMKDYGERVLKSVFECNIGEEQFARMLQRIDRVIDPVEDSVRFIRLCGKCVGKVEVVGQGEPFVEDEPFLVLQRPPTRAGKRSKS